MTCSSLSLSHSCIFSSCSLNVPSLETGNKTSSRRIHKHTSINNTASSEGWDRCTLRHVHAQARARSCNDILTMSERAGGSRKTHRGNIDGHVNGSWLCDGQKTRHGFRLQPPGSRSLLVDLLVSSRCIQGTVNKSFIRGTTVSTSASQRSLRRFHSRGDKSSDTSFLPFLFCDCLTFPTESHSTNWIHWGRWSL